MKALKTTAILSFRFLVAGCTTFHANTDFHRGRMALLGGMPLEAFPHLEPASAINGEIKYSQLLEGPGLISDTPITMPRNILKRAKPLSARLRSIRTIALPGFTWGLR